MMVGTAVLPSAVAPAGADKAAVSPAVAGADDKPGFASMIGGLGRAPAPNGKIAAKADDKDDTDRDKAPPGGDDDAAILLALSAQAAPLLAAAPVPAAPISNAVQKATDEVKPERAPAKSTVATIATMPMASVTNDAPAAPPPVADAPLKSSPAALLAALSAKPDGPQPPSAPAVVANDQSSIATVAPLAVQGSTSAILLARTISKPVADRVKAAKPSDAAQDDAGTATSDAAPTTPIAAPASPAPTLVTTSTATPIVDAGQSLATGGADRQLDLAKDSAWLDGLSRDIASTGDAGGTLRFGLSPQRLGDIQVELKRGDDGAAITLTTGNAATQAILTDAKPQLLADARAHGLHISDARVDLGGSSTSGQGTNSGSRSQTHADASATTQQGSTGDSGRQAQQRAQAEPEILGRPARFAMTSATPEKTSAVVNASETDARYA